MRRLRVPGDRTEVAVEEMAVETKPLATTKRVMIRDLVRNDLGDRMTVAEAEAPEAVETQVTLNLPVPMSQLDPLR